MLCMCWTCAHRHLHANLMYGECGWTHPSREMTSVCPVKLLAIWRAKSLASDLVGGGEGEGRGRGSGGEELMVNGSRGSLSLDTDTHACMAHRHTYTCMAHRHTTSTCILSHSKHCTCTAHALHMFFDIDTQSHHSGMGSTETWLCTAFRQSHQVQGSHTRYALPLKPCMVQLLPGTPKLRETVPRKRCQVLHGPPQQ